jgi:phosphoserine phosphatase RsbU/P
MGLTIVRQIVDAHGGTLSVASTPAAGTAITLSLPRGDAPR